MTPPTRTAAATEARRNAKTDRLCRELAGRLDTMPSDMLAALAFIVIEECEKRGQQRRGQGAA